MDYPDNKAEEAGERKAEFNMGSFDYERIYKMLTGANDLSFAVMNMEYEYLRPFISAISEIYNNIRPVMVKSKQKDLDKKILKAKKTLRYAESLIDNHNKRKLYNYGNNGYPAILKQRLELCVDKIEEVWQLVLQEKQIIGMGIVLKPAFSKRSMVKLGVRGVGGISREQSRFTEGNGQP